MKKIFFSDKFGLTRAVLEGRKTMTRRIVPDGTPLGNWGETSKKARYKIGEVVAVAQSYKNIRDIIGDIQDGKSIKFMPGWNNKRFVRADLMPHKIRITGVRVERLQDITDEECLKEGVQREGSGYYVRGVLGQSDIIGLSARGVYEILVDRINGKGTWEKNPWVYVYEFELVK